MAKAVATKEKKAPVKKAAPAKKKAVKVPALLEVIEEQRIFIVTLYANKAQVTKNKPKRIFKVTYPIQVKVYEGNNPDELMAAAIKKAEDAALDAVRGVVGLSGVLVAEEQKEEN